MTTYIVYKTTNLLNGMWYIGMFGSRGTKKDSEYLGSGREIKKAIAKFGPENFKRETLFTFKSAREARQKEAELAEPANPLTYNVNKGGHSWYYVNTNLPPAAVGIGNRGANKGLKYGPQSIEHRQKLSAAHKGISRPHMRKPKSARTKQLMSIGRRNSQKAAAANAVRLACPHCGKQADYGNYNRWHGNRCKLQSRLQLAVPIEV